MKIPEDVHVRILTHRWSYVVLQGAIHFGLKAKALDTTMFAVVRSKQSRLYGKISPATLSKGAGCGGLAGGLCAFAQKAKYRVWN